MNKQGPGKIDWTDYTWNPVTGCKHGCSYCYARQMARRFGHSFEPAFHPERLVEPSKVKKPSRIFVCSNADLFGDWVSLGWIDAVFSMVEACPQHIFQFLTKNPHRFIESDGATVRNSIISLPNVWVGTTLDCRNIERDLGRLDSLIINLMQSTLFVSFEPLLGMPSEDMLDSIVFLDWVVIGGLTGPGAITPDAKWVRAILDACDAANTPVFLKDNLNWPEMRKEWPSTQVDNDHAENND